MLSDYVTLTFDPLTLNIWSTLDVMWSKSAPDLSKIKQSTAELLQFKDLKFGGGTHLGFCGRWISIFEWPLQTSNTPTYHIWAKSKNLWLNHWWFSKFLLFMSHCDFDLWPSMSMVHVCYVLKPYTKYEWNQTIHHWLMIYQVYCGFCQCGVFQIWTHTNSEGVERTKPNVVIHRSFICT